MDEANEIKGTHEIGRHFDAGVYNKQYFVGGFEAGVSGYDDYDNCQEIVEKQFEIIDEVMRDRVAKKTNVDVGCAYGFSCNKLRTLGWESSGFDVSQWAVEQAKEKFGDCFTVGNAMELETWLNQPKVELVTGVEFFEHIDSHDVETVIAGAASLANWGLFLINCRTYPGEDEHNSDADHGHLNNHNFAWWVTQLGKFGELDWLAMHELNKLAEAVEDVTWVGRFAVIRFSK